MDSVRALERLLEHQRQIGTLLEEADNVLNGLEPAQAKALALLRWQLLRVLRSYQLFKHVELFDPLCRSADVAKAVRARDMKRCCVAIGEDYAGHVKRWAVASIDSDWPAYRAEAEAMVGRLRSHLRQEATAARLLLAGVERTRRA